MKKNEIEEAIRTLTLDRLFGINIPEEVYKVTVRNVFDETWRVNVYMRGEHTIVIPYSYLIKFSIEEGIVSSVPDIVRHIETELSEPKRKTFDGMV